MSRPAEEMLYLAMEDFRVDVVVGKGPGATAIPWKSPLHAGWGHHPGWSTAGPVARPLRLHRAAGLLRRHSIGAHPAPLCRAAGSPAGAAGATEIARRSRGTRASPTGCCAGYATTPRSERMAA